MEIWNFWTSLCCYYEANDDLYLGTGINHGNSFLSNFLTVYVNNVSVCF